MKSGVTGHIQKVQRPSLGEGCAPGAARETQGCLLRAEQEKVKDINAEVDGQKYW